MQVLELVATEVESKYGVALNQYACGWTLLRPFGNRSIKVRHRPHSNHLCQSDPRDIKIRSLP
jgi:hypothetical protein